MALRAPLFVCTNFVFSPVTDGSPSSEVGRSTRTRLSVLQELLSHCQLHAQSRSVPRYCRQRAPLKGGSDKNLNKTNMPCPGSQLHSDLGSVWKGSFVPSTHNYTAAKDKNTYNIVGLRAPFRTAGPRQFVLTPPTPLGTA